MKMTGLWRLKKAARALAHCVDYVFLKR